MEQDVLKHNHSFSDLINLSLPEESLDESFLLLDIDQCVEVAAARILIPRGRIGSLWGLELQSWADIRIPDSCVEVAKELLRKLKDRQ